MEKNRYRIVDENNQTVADFTSIKVEKGSTICVMMKRLMPLEELNHFSKYLRQRFPNCNFLFTDPSTEIKINGKEVTINENNL